jgi:serine/threonine protein kinase
VFLPELGQIVGNKYQLIREIGRGAMGAVFEGVHVELGKPVAIKVLLKYESAGGEEIARFHQEAWTAASVGHRGIIDIYDVGISDDGCPYLVMERLRGSNLEEHIARSAPREVSFVSYIGYQVLSALSAMQQIGIVHHDLKPGNIFLVHTGAPLPEVKVLDFGISRVIKFDATDTATRLTKSGIVNGADELLVTPNHGQAEPKVYIYTTGGTLKKDFWAYDAPVNQGLSAAGIEDRIYTTPNNGSSQVNAFDKSGERKNFWWVYEQHVRGDFSIRAAQLYPATDKEELLISPIGQNGPHILGYRATGEQKATPNFFAFGDETLRNGVGIATIENWHGVN